ncbi:MAG: hypothetical protein J6Y66_07095, partial [Bacteroidales bacterium]|nr:hypothetical protein [Bacteroidales bacterium]
ADGGTLLPPPSLKMPVFADGGVLLPPPSLKVPVFADGGTLLPERDVEKLMGFIIFVGKRDGFGEYN